MTDRTVSEETDNEILEVPMDLATHPQFGVRVSALRYAKESLQDHNQNVFGSNTKSDLTQVGIDGLLTVAGWLIEENYELFKNPGPAILGMRMIDAMMESARPHEGENPPSTCGDPDCRGCQERYQEWFRFWEQQNKGNTEEGR